MTTTILRTHVDTKAITEVAYERLEYPRLFNLQLNVVVVVR